MNEISVNLYCVLMRSGIQIWVESEKAENLRDLLVQITAHKFVKFEDQVFNTADLEGVYNAETMNSLTRRKNGQWLCRYDKWHDRKEECGCLSEEAQRKRAAFRANYHAQYGFDPL